MRDMIELEAIVTILTTLALGWVGADKLWLGYADWQDPSNWLARLGPESDSLVVFPLEMRHAVGLPHTAGELRLAGMQLPRNGLVALPENGKILVSEAGVGEQQRVSRWLREGPFFWVDPLNWNSSLGSEAVPHLERLPCQSELVVLPAASNTFSAWLPLSRSVEVRGVRLADSDYVLSRWAWRDAAERPEFRAGGTFSVRYSPSECKNCPCQEGDLSAYWEEVCSVQRPRCNLLACEHPLKVEGHCCFYCGGRVRISKKALLSSVERVAGAILKRYEDTLFWHSRVTWDGESEILITERGPYDGTSIIIAIADVVAALKEERVEVLYSEMSGDALRGYRLLAALGPMFGGFCSALLLILVLFPLFGYSFSQLWQACREVGAAMCAKRRSSAGGKASKSFGFARFENVSEGNVQLAEAREEDPATGGSNENFENPLYRAEKPSEKESVSLASLELAAIELDRIDIEF